MKYKLVHRAAVAKAHLGFCRVHIDINAVRVDLDKDHVSGVAVAMQLILVGRAQRMHEKLVAYESAVDEHILVVA